MICQAIFVISLFLAAEINSASTPACHSFGNVTIPFPFGTTSDCILDESFLITCNPSYHPPKPFLNSGTMEVLDISLDGLMRVASSVAADCYNEFGTLTRSTASKFLSRFPISSTRNKFTTVGCDTHAFIKGSDEKWKQMNVGCMSWCDNANNLVNGTCSGIGCCQTLLPDGVKDFLVDIQSFRNHTGVHSVNPCSYASVVESEAFKFLSVDLIDLQNRKSVPVVLDWSVGNVTCHEVDRRDFSTFAFKARHSECTDSGIGNGYLCKCLAGFDGNPYFKDGCQDIDECDPQNNPCNGKCTNLPGSYSCSCPKGFGGDGNRDGSGCHPKSQISRSFIFYFASGLMVPAVGGVWIFRKRRQNKVAKLRRGLFHSNGGNLLENIVSNQMSFAIFAAEDLEKATANYSNIMWTEYPPGSKGYEGILPDGRRVSIYRHKADEHNAESFISTLFLLSQQERAESN